MNLENFDIIFGIDQTGAVKTNRQAKPLPCALLIRKKDNWKLLSRHSSKDLCLQSLTLPALKDLLSVAGLDFEMSKILIVVDSVIGLPADLQMTKNPNQEIRQTIEMATQPLRYGSKPAEAFFSKILKSRGHANAKRSAVEFPKRKVELHLGANSVFRSRPFQKNIQTGTYRIWKDLSTPIDEPSRSHQNTLQAVQLWDFENCKMATPGKPILLEGYPSLAWKILNQSQRGKPIKTLRPTFKGAVTGLSGFEQLSADHQDAVMLTLLAHKMLSDGTFRRKSRVDLEGDILGSQIDF